MIIYIYISNIQFSIADNLWFRCSAFVTNVPWAKTYGLWSSRFILDEPVDCKHTWVSKSSNGLIDIAEFLFTMQLLTMANIVSAVWSTNRICFTMFGLIPDINHDFWYWVGVQKLPSLALWLSEIDQTEGQTLSYPTNQWEQDSKGRSNLGSLTNNDLAGGSATHAQRPK